MAISSLGYVGFSARDLGAWAEFGGSILGLMPVDAPDDEVRFRMDAQAWRIAVEQGQDDDVAYLGFEAPGPAQLVEIRRSLASAGVEVEDGDGQLLRRRGVTALLRCRDPEGLAVEIYYGPTERRETPFVSPAGTSGFVTGPQGLGHVVLAARDIAATRRFYGELLGFQLSDVIRLGRSAEPGTELEFYHCNPRHHTLALAPASSRRRLLHFMLQAATLDDVGLALDRMRRAEIPLTHALGKHTNDHMVSFYARTPSGFEVEYGWGAREIGEDWRVVRHDRTSIWGHQRL